MSSITENNNVDGKIDFQEICNHLVKLNDNQIDNIYDNLDQSLIRGPMSYLYFMRCVLLRVGKSSRDFLKANYYEYDVLKDYERNHGQKSICRKGESIQFDYYPLNMIRELIEELKELDPEMEDEEYFNDTTFKNNKTDIERILMSGTISSLNGYTKFELFSQIAINEGCTSCNYRNCGDPPRKQKFIERLLELSPQNSLLTHIINNSIDLGKENSEKLLVYFTKYTDDINLFEKIRNKNDDINKKYEDGFTLLHYASQNHNISIIHHLLNINADKDITTNNNELAIDLYLKNKFYDSDVLKRLFPNKEVSKLSIDVIFRLFESHDFYDIIFEYIKKTSTEELNNNFSRGINILMKLLQTRYSFEMVQYLVEQKKVSLTIKDKNNNNAKYPQYGKGCYHGFLPLHFALRYSGSDFKLIKYIVDKMEEFDDDKSLDYYTSEEGLTPLHIACIFGSVQTIEYLLLVKKCNHDIPVTRYYGKSSNYTLYQLTEMNETIQSSDLDHIQTLILKFIGILD